MAARGAELFAASGPQLAGAAECMDSCSKYCVRDFTRHRQSLSPRTVGLKETSGDLVHFSSEEVLDILRSSLTSVQIFKSSTTEPSTYLPSLEFVFFFPLYLKRNLLILYINLLNLYLSWRQLFLVLFSADTEINRLQFSVENILLLSCLFLLVSFLD